jgi:hypothetical protein
MKRFKSFGLLAGLMLCTPILGGADGGCDIVIGDGDGDGDGDVGDGDGDGDGDGYGSCQSDADCAEGQLCAIPDCAAVCLQNPDDPTDECWNDCPTEGECIDINPGPCAAVDCAPGYHCEVEVLCWDGDCAPPDEPNDEERDPAQEPYPCGGGCEETAVCIADHNPYECFEDSDCGPGFYCDLNGWGAPAPCYDDNGDGQCDDDATDRLVAPGFCQPIDEPSLCDQIDCGPGEECVEETYCTGLPYPCDCDPDQNDCECGDYQDECFTDAYCVPVSNDDCYDIDPEQCYQTPGCHLEEVYPPCAQPEPCYDDNGDGECDPVEPWECEPILMCVPDYVEPEGSCADRCGEVGSSGQCFCDDLCMQYGDCCEDFYEFCENIVPPGCNSDDECGPDAYCDYRETCYDDFGNGQECFVEGVCIPYEPQDPCNQFPAAVCEEVEGCQLIEIVAPCEPGPNGDIMCDDFEVLCVSSEPPPPNGCLTADGDDLCGEGGQCVTETFCYDYCDQTVPDPECCFTESYCVYDPPPPPNGCYGDDGQPLCGEGERCEEVTTCEDFCMDPNGDDCCFTDIMCVPDTDPPVCIQVETEATNPQTGNCVVFPTPCDVPADWELGCHADGDDPNQP